MESQPDIYITMIPGLLGPLVMNLEALDGHVEGLSNNIWNIPLPRTLRFAALYQTSPYNCVTTINDKGIVVAQNIQNFDETDHRAGLFEFPASNAKKFIPKMP